MRKTLFFLFTVSIMSEFIFGQSKEAQEWKERGNQLRFHGRYAEAEVAYKTAIDKDPKYDEAWNGLGNTYYSWGKKKEALKSYEESLRLNPKNAELKLLVQQLREQLKVSEEIPKIERIPKEKFYSPKSEVEKIREDKKPLGRKKFSFSVGGLSSIPLKKHTNFKKIGFGGDINVYYNFSKNTAIGLGTDIVYFLTSAYTYYYSHQIVGWGWYEEKTRWLITELKLLVNLSTPINYHKSTRIFLELGIGPAYIRKSVDYKGFYDYYIYLPVQSQKAQTRLSLSIGQGIRFG